MINIHKGTLFRYKYIRPEGRLYLALSSPRVSEIDENSFEVIALVDEKVQRLWLWNPGIEIVC
jgi:hypothetical protein